MNKIIPALLICAFFSQKLVGQKITICSDSISSSFRGLSVVNDNIIWVSGSNGTVGRSVDAGKTWKWMKVKGYEKTDFRDIEAFNENTAIIMGVDTPAYILKTTDGGQNWRCVYKNVSKGMFLDALAFGDKKNGIVLGDPVDGRFFMMKTSDGGNSWQNNSIKARPVADSGEACFAASGTNIRITKKEDVVFISGGVSSHLFINGSNIWLPLQQGKESTGANSIALNGNIMIVVGGDFLKKDNTSGNCVFSPDGGKTWKKPEISPSGYRSCVEYLSGRQWITCGLNGVDISNNDGNSWKSISNESFNVVQKAKNGTAVFLAGSNGKVARLDQQANK